MNRDVQNNSGPNGLNNPPEPARKSVLVIVALVGLAAVGAVIAFKSFGKKETSQPIEPTVAPAQADAKSTKPKVWTPPPSPAVVVTEATTPATVVTTAPPVAPVVQPTESRPEATPYTRQLVASLAQIDLSQKEVTAEQAAAWKQNLQTLVQRGAEAVPAIREFLDQHKDVRFDNVSGGNQMGATSMRSAMIDALGAIGGPEGLQGTLAALTGNTSPAEIAQIAQSLEKQAPEQYRQQTLDAARGALDQAVAGKLANEDVGPLFKVLQQYGGASSVADLERFSGNWRYYSTIALANLPDNAGIPSLVQMVMDPNSPYKSNRSAALQALAQVAPASPEATSALVEQAKANAIPYPTWITIASVLGGHQFDIGTKPVDPANPDATVGNLKTWHLAMGNQNFYSAPPFTGLTDQNVSQRLALIDQLDAVNANQSIKDMLQQARTTLQNRGK